MSEVELDITALAAGGDGVGRDASGRVTFVPHTAPGDRVRVRIARATKSYARAELVRVIAPSRDRIDPPCVHFAEGCGGCQWQHVARPAQLAAKQAIVEHALRALGVRVHAIADPAPPYGWRRRARFHVAGGVVGLYARGSHRVVPIASCAQLEPDLDAALRALIAKPPRDGELSIARGFRGEIAIGDDTVELEPGVVAGAREFAQASAAGNAALVAIARAAVGTGPGALLELYAGSGNLTRAFRADGWTVTATDRDHAELAGDAADVIAAQRGPFDAIVLDPPRTGAAPTVIAGIARLAPRAIVYVSCDPATLARDAARLVEGGYRATDAWPIDLMPQTAHVEVVVRLVTSGG